MKMGGSGVRYLPPMSRGCEPDMDRSTGSDTETSQLMQLVHEELARVRSTHPSVSAAAAGALPVGAARGAAPVSPIPRLADSQPELPTRARYSLDEFLAYQDEDFVRNAYRGLLGREPDLQGLNDYLGALRSGTLGKTEILGRIRYSPEGRRRGTPVRGLAVPFSVRMLRRVPVAGRFIAIVQYVWRLPVIARNHERLETAVFHHEAELKRQINAAHAVIEHQLRTAAQRIDAAEGAEAARAQRIDHLAKTFDAGRLDAAGALNRAAADLTAAIETRASIAELSQMGQQIAAAMDAKAARSELTQLTNHLAAMVESRPSTADLQRVEQGLSSLRDRQGDLERRKADAQALAAIAAELHAEARSALDALGVLRDGKADRSELDVLRKSGNEQIDNAWGTFTIISDVKADRDQLDALAREHAAVVVAWAERAAALEARCTALERTTTEAMAAWRAALDEHRRVLGKT